MSNPSKSRDALVYSAGIAILLGFLAFLPELARPRLFPFLLEQPKPTPPLLIPSDRLFAQIPSGPKLSIASVTGKEGFALVNFWATWCPPCIEELPSLEHLKRALAESPQRNVAVVALSVDEDPKLIPRLIGSLDFKSSLLVLHDAGAEVARSLGIAKFPETVLVNGQGQVLYKWVGPQDWLSADVLDILKRYTVKGI